MVIVKHDHHRQVGSQLFGVQEQMYLRKEIKISATPKQLVHRHTLLVSGCADFFGYA